MFFGATAAGPVMVIPVIVAVWGVVISAIYMLRAYRNVFWGPVVQRWESIADIANGAKWAVILLLLPLMIAGFYPQFILKMAGTALPH